MFMFSHKQIVVFFLIQWLIFISDNILSQIVIFGTVSKGLNQMVLPVLLTNKILKLYPLEAVKSFKSMSVGHMAQSQVLNPHQ